MGHAEGGQRGTKQQNQCKYSKSIKRRKTNKQIDLFQSVSLLLLFVSIRMWLMNIKISLFIERKRKWHKKQKEKTINHCIRYISGCAMCNVVFSPFEIGLSLYRLLFMILVPCPELLYVYERPFVIGFDFEPRGESLSV